MLTAARWAMAQPAHPASTTSEQRSKSATARGRVRGAARQTGPICRTAERATGALELALSTERPRERLAIHGATALSAVELIGVLWGSGIRGRSAVDAASDVLRRHEGLVVSGEL